MGSKPKYQRKIAEERIDILFEEASNAFSEHPERAHRYVEIARNIAMKFNLSMSDTYKQRFCKHCYRYLSPGENARIRLTDGTKVITCEECGEQMRFPYRK